MINCLHTVQCTMFMILNSDSEMGHQKWNLHAVCSFSESSGSTV